MSAGSATFRLLRDLRAAAEGDAEVMNRERAETYLRVLAEAELRRATSQSCGDAQRAGHAARVKKVAQVLAFAGALDEGVAGQLLDDFELALGARPTGQAASVPGWFTRRAAVRTRLARQVSALRVEIVPPLSRATTSIKVQATGRSAQAHARLPLRWQ